MRKRVKRSRPLKRFILFGLLLTLILILVGTTVGRQNFNSAHKLALEVLGVGQSGITSVTGYFSGFWERYIALMGVRDENQILREALAKEKQINNTYREAIATNVRLTKLLGIKETFQSPTVAALIIGRDPSPWFKTVVVNQGSSDGVQKGMPVVTVEGVVGQVMDTSPNQSRVLLANDPNSAIDVLIQKSRVQGMIKGSSNGYSLLYILKNTEVVEGDRIVTSGLGGMFPKGLPVGTVSRVVKNRRGMFQQIDIEPTVDFSQLEYLLIILKDDSLAE